MTNQEAAGQAFYNTPKFTLRDLPIHAGWHQLGADFNAYLDCFLPNIQEFLAEFEFASQLPRLSKADARQEVAGAGGGSGGHPAPRTGIGRLAGRDHRAPSE